MNAKKTFKRLTAVATGATLLGATMMGALAADLSEYPDMFVSEGAFDGALVIGSIADPVDNIAITDIATNMWVAGADATTSTSVEGDSYKFGEGGNMLEFEEGLVNLTTFLDSDDLDALDAWTVDTSKGSGTYDQYLRFSSDSSARVVFEEADDEDDTTALFLKLSDNEQFAQYHMDFTQDIESDIVSGEWEDLEDEAFYILGKEYSVVSTSNTSVRMDLMTGTVKGLLQEGEAQTYTIDGTEYDIELHSVDSDSEAKFIINGELTRSLADGETERLDGGINFGVSDVTNQQITGGIRDAEFWLGADKIRIEDSATMQVNDESINGLVSEITNSQTGSEVTISSIKVNMTAQDDYWVPAGGYLSENYNMEEPELVFTENWDFYFAGFAEELSNPIDLKSDGGEEGYSLTFTNVAGNAVKFRLAYDGSSTPKNADNSGTTTINGHFGDKDEILHITAASTENPIYDDEWFILNTDTDKDSETYVVQYKGHDDNDTSDPKLKLSIHGLDDGVSVTRNVDIESTQTTAILSLGGDEFTFTISDPDEKDSNITAISGGSYSGQENLIYTEYGAKMFLTTSEGASAARNTTAGLIYAGTADTNDDNSTMVGGELLINITEFDTNRMDDYTGGDLVAYNITASSNELDATKYGGISLIESDANEDVNEGYSTYGSFVSEDAGDSDQKTSVTITYPATQLEAGVYVTSGAATATTVATGDLERVDVPSVKLDSELASLSAQHVITVGGPCVNTVSAELLGSPADCTEGFTPGVARVKVFENGDYVAMLVAGYSGDDTRLAGQVIANRWAEMSGEEVEIEGTTYMDATLSAPSVAAAADVADDVVDDVADADDATADDTTADDAATDDTTDAE